MLTLTRRQGVSLAIAAAAAGTARAQPARNVLVGGFDVGPGGYPGNFNPLAATAGFQWLNLYYETLVLYETTALENIVGALAAKFEANAARTEYTFSLVPDAKWHDGTPFTSADVAFTIELAKDARSGSIAGSRLADVTEVRTPDAATAVLVLAKPNAGLLDTLTRLMMLPKHALEGLPREGLDRNPWWSKTPIGTGPFSFVRYEADQFVELTANPAYRRGKPKLDGVINRYFKNTAGAVAALRAGEIQFSYVEADEAQAFAGNNAFAAIEGNSWVINYLGFNHAAGMWSDVRVRRAVLHAINRDAIVKSVLKDAGDIANSIYIAARFVRNDLDPYTYDPAIAKVLLTEAGWDKINGNKPLTLLTYYNNPLATNVLAAIQAMLAQVGVNVVPRAVDVATYNGIVYAKTPDPTQYPLVYAGAPNGPDPGIANLNLNENQIPPAGSNIMRVRIPTLNAALDGALGVVDDAKRTAMFQQVAKVFNSELPWAPLWVQRRYGIVAAGLHNFVWTPSPGGGSYDQHAETWSFS